MLPTNKPANPNAKQRRTWLIVSPFVLAIVSLIIYSSIITSSSTTGGPTVASRPLATKVIAFAGWAVAAVWLLALPVLLKKQK